MTDIVVTTKEILRRSEAFADLPAPLLNQIVGICREIRHAKGDFVFQVGDASRDIFILAEGAVDVGFAVSTDDGNAAAIREPGEVLGWSALVGETAYRMINAVCVQESRFIAIDGLELMRLFEASPAAGFSFLRKLIAILLNRIVSIAAA